MERLVLDVRGRMWEANPDGPQDIIHVKAKRQRRSDFMKPCNESIKVLLTGWNLTTVGRDEPMNALVLTWCLRKGVEVQ